MRLRSVAFVLAALLAGCATQHGRISRNDRCAFVEFSDFKRAQGVFPYEAVLTSPIIKAPIDWNELVVSWNVSPETFLKVEARGIYPDHTTKYYTLGLWSEDTAKHPRQSVEHQRDDDGTVQTDTLVLNRHGADVQLRLSSGSTTPGVPPDLKFVGLSFCNTKAQPAPRKPNRAAWGKVINVPERRQAEYEGGGAWCSPTSLSMVLAYWSEKLHRPDLNRSVPEVAAAINDDVLGGTGNWPFNTAYAGSFPGMRAYVARLDDISDLEDWIAAGVPVVISVSSYLTNDRHSGPDNGHLIVCCGFTEDGDVVTNDPGVSVKRNIRARRVYPRARVIAAWSKSKNTVYLIYPEDVKVPAAR